MGQGWCNASKETIARNLDISPRTVIRHLHHLCSGDEPYLKDLSPDLRNRPHTYVDTGQIRLDADNHAAAVTQSQTITMTESQTKASKGVTESPSAMTQSHSTMTQSPPRYDTKSHEESIRESSQETKEETGPPRILEKPLVLTKEQLEPDPELMALWDAAVIPELKMSMTATTFNEWLHPSTLINVFDGIAVVQVPTSYAVEWCRERLKPAILTPLIGILKYERELSIRDVRFVCA